MKLELVHNHPLINSECYIEDAALIIATLDISFGVRVNLIAMLSLFFYSLSRTNAAMSFELIKCVCKEVEELGTKGSIITYANCLEALESDSRTQTTWKLKNLAKIALELALANVIESKAYNDDLLNKNYTSVPIKW